MRQQTTNATVYGEFGRVPLAVIRKVRIVRYWFKISKFPNCLVYKLYNMRDINGNYINKWSNDVKTLLDNLGFSYLWNSAVVTNGQIQSVIKCIHDQYLQQWFSDLRNLPKLETYCMFKTYFQSEKYLSCVTNVNYRIYLSRFRCSAHNLLIEEGRHRNIDRNQRMCTKCNMNCIETEYHFLLVCPFYRDVRNNCLPHYYCHWPNLNKFKSLLQCSQSNIINKLSKYIYQATVIRG